MNNFKTSISALALKLFGLLPLSLARVLGRLLALLLQVVSNDIEKITRVNLKLSQPQLNADALQVLTQQSISSTLINAFEMPIVWQHSNQWLNKKVLHIENLAALTGALNKHKGVIAICPHVGNWEVFGRILPNYGATTNLYQPPKYKSMENIVRTGREKSGATLVPTSQRGIAALLKALRRGEIIGILPDQVPKNDSGVFVPFFNVPALSMTLVYSLIQKTQCRVVLGYALRSGKGFKIIFKEAPEAIYNKDQHTSVSALSKMVEMSTEEDLSQYQWAYKRFKRQPDGGRPYT